MSLTENLKKSVNRYLDKREVKKLEYDVRLVVRQRSEFKSWSDKELKLTTVAFKDDLQKGKPLSELLVPAFAVAGEVSRRVTNKVPYDVQVLAGMVIHQGKIAEMRAGEGKTLTETMPVYLNALTGNGVHIITTNDYLAERDCKAMGELYKFLGLTANYVGSNMKNETRRKAYASDITYVSNQEIGFDFLRDNLVYSRADRVLRPQHPLHFGIVDEIDSILIDESRTPLIIAEPVKEERSYYDYFNKIANQLVEDEDFVVDYRQKNLTVTDKGLNKVEKIIGQPVFSKDNPLSVFYLDVCLKARILFEKDRDYIVTGGNVEIVDEFTGRVLPGRRFTDGVHQAIEAKEGLKAKESDRTAAAITFQNFYPMYEKLSGMSGTVMDAREEFNLVYKLDVVQIPTNKPLARIDHNDLFFKTRKGKFMGMMKKVLQIHKRGQPLLIGTRNVETAHEVAGMLSQYDLAYQLLTAADNRAEAEKIAQAGQEGMITIATNMAGRGTDIMLGPGVAELGGLYVLGTERHESRRIDGQLIGRAGRQGDPGESQFLISMEDEIMQLFGSEEIIDVLEEYDMPEDEYISGKGLDEAFKKAQDFVESKNLDSRLYLYKYDRVANYQRDQLYRLRDSLLENPEGFKYFMSQAVRDVVANVFSLDDAKLIANELKNIFGVQVHENELAEAFRASGGRQMSQQKLAGYFATITQKLEQFPEGFEAAQQLVLQVIDNCWSDHLEYMDILKEEANLFSYASEDPLIDFIAESQHLFEHMGQEIQKRFIKSLFVYLGKQGVVGK